MDVHTTTIQAEELAYWYLRLNGFLTIHNFVVHPEQGSGQKTDVDLLAARFPFRNELKSMCDDERVMHVRNRTIIALGEVKRRTCGLNGPWTKPSQQNMQRVLRALGPFPEAEIGVAAKALYCHGYYNSQLYHVSLLCFGEIESPEIKEAYPGVPQIIWVDALKFIHERFRRYSKQKASHDQWDDQGKYLWRCYQRTGNAEEFRNMVLSDLLATPADGE